MTVLSDNKAQENVQQTNVEAQSLQVTDTNIQSQNIPKNTNENSKTEDESNLDPNWKAFREARKIDRELMKAAEKKAAEKEAEATALKEAMEAAFARNAPSQQAQQQYYGMNQTEIPDETEDQRIEKKVNALLAQKEQQFAKQQQEREQIELPNRLKRDFPDFDKVCSQENLDYLDYHFPEVSRPLDRLPQGYERWHDIYHAVKKLIPNQANVKKDMARADNNMNRPKSISSATQTPPGENTKQSWQEMEQRRSANWSRMQKILKGVG